MDLDFARILRFLIRNFETVIVVFFVLSGIVGPVIRGIREARQRAAELARKRASGELPERPLIEEPPVKWEEVDEPAEELEQIPIEPQPEPPPAAPARMRREIPPPPPGPPVLSTAEMDQLIEGAREERNAKEAAEERADLGEEVVALTGERAGSISDIAARVSLREAVLWSEVLGTPVSLRGGSSLRDGRERF